MRRTARAERFGSSWIAAVGPIRHPQRAEQRPNTDFIDWHRREVFRGSPRDTEALLESTS